LLLLFLGIQGTVEPHVMEGFAVTWLVEV
jgi:hypothetical protein